MNAGLAELVTDSWDEFKDRVVDLSNDIDSLRVIRQNLRTIVLNSPLCDIKSFAQSFSLALRATWLRHCEGKSPAALAFSDTHTGAQFEGESEPVLKLEQSEVSTRKNQP